MVRGITFQNFRG